MFGHSNADSLPPIDRGKGPTGDDSERRAALEALDEALLKLQPFTNEDRVRASLVINPLLDVWDAAHRLGPDVAWAVEALLTLSVHRSMLNADEILACVTTTRARAQENDILAAS